MSKSIFNTDDTQQKRLAKEARTYNPEIGSVLSHSTASIPVSNDPTKNRIKPEDLAQKRTLESNAKVYSARRNESNVTF